MSSKPGGGGSTPSAKAEAPAAAATVPAAPVKTSKSTADHTRFKQLDKRSEDLARGRDRWSYAPSNGTGVPSARYAYSRPFSAGATTATATTTTATSRQSTRPTV